MNSLERSGFVGVKEKIVPIGAGKPDPLLFSSDIALHVQTPRVQPRLERNRLEGNFDLRAPAVAENLGFGRPDSIPVQAVMLTEGQALAPGPTRVDKKDVAVPFILEGIEKNPDQVAAPPVVIFLLIMNHRVSRDLRGFTIVAIDAEIETGFIIKDAELCPFGRLAVRLGLDHLEIGERIRLLPDFIGKNTVEDRTLLDPGRFELDGIHLMESGQNKGRQNYESLFKPHEILADPGRDIIA